MAQPSQTLYVQNLGEGLKTADLKRNLYHLFSNHGKVLDVVASRAKGMKGQAFVVFQEMAAATAARRREDGNPFLGKRMRIQYAKEKSHATIKQEDGPEALYFHKIGLHDAKTQRLTVSSAEKTLEASKNKRELEQGGGEEDGVEEPPAKKGRLEAPPTETIVEDDVDAMEEEESDSEQPAAAPVAAPENPPHHILQVSNLPSEADQEMLQVLFQQFPGLVTVRHSVVSASAIVYYENWQVASEAKAALDGFQMAKDMLIKVGFAPRTMQ